MNKKISEYRSEIIEKFINIEWLINAIICQHYLKKVVYAFLFEVLYDINCSFALKRNILEKIAPKFSKLADLNRLNNIRNLFAHCNQQVFEYNQKPELWEQGKVLNPKNIEKELNFKELYNEFTQKEGEITKDLAKLFISLGGELEK